MIAAVKKLHDPDHGVYGIALRGQRGSGANVWRWMPYFRGFGGKWFDGNTPVFDGEPAVKATQTYLDLFKYSPPGTKTGSWDKSTGAFLSGQVALLVESTPLAGEAIDPKVSKVVGKVGYAPPPSPLTGGGYAPWPRHRREGEQGRRREEMRRPVHRLGDVEGEREAPPRRRRVRRAQPHQHHDERRVQPEVRRGPWPGAGRRPPK